MNELQRETRISAFQCAQNKRNPVRPAKIELNVYYLIEKKVEQGTPYRQDFL
ncbi:hypothetical protein ANO14919_026630 [Xylariales sp. No.14919]|nr:hypothetical protein ANO14919_026630 [Xylariales sp. No.14919]